MNVQVIKHPYREFEGAAFISLEGVPVFMADDQWAQVMGVNFVLPGGTEVDVNDKWNKRSLEDIEECDHDWEDAYGRRPDLFVRDVTDPADPYRLLVPVIVNDIDLPPMKIMVKLVDLKKVFQRVDPGDGQHARGSANEHTESSCNHTIHEIGQHKCRTCMRRFWMIKAKELGVIDG